MNLIIHTILVATCILTAITIANLSESQNAHSTHISVPVLTVRENLEYFFEDDLIISGWVEYNNNPTSDVLLNIKTLDQNHVQISDTFVTSDSNGEFEYAFSLPDYHTPGDYSVIITSMCWEQHRQICTYNTAQIMISVSESKGNGDIYIPKWVKIIAEFWVVGQIDDVVFLQAVEFLVRNDMIVLGDSDNDSFDNNLDALDRIKTSAKYWVADDIMDEEFAASIKWLINNNITSTDV